MLTLCFMVLHQKTQTDFNVYRTALPSSSSRQRHYDHVTHLLHELHWLPIPSRIHFKLLTIVYKCFLDSAKSPSYITELIQPYIPSRGGLRSAQDTRLLIVPHTRTLTGDKGFFAAGPSLWNKLPHHIRHAPTLATFRSHLKTHLFDYWFCYLFLYVSFFIVCKALWYLVFLCKSAL